MHCLVTVLFTRKFASFYVVCRDQCVFSLLGMGFKWTDFSPALQENIKRAVFDKSVPLEENQLSTLLERLHRMSE